MTSGVEVRDGSAYSGEAVSASAEQAYLAVALLHTVPAVVVSWFFFGLHGFLTAGELAGAVRSPLGQLLATGCLAAVLSAVMWSLYALLSFWLARLQRMFGSRGRGLLFLAVLPSFLLGPLYAFGLVATAAWRHRHRRLFLWSLPGVLLGHVALLGVLNMLAGELAVCWANALLVPAVTLALALCAARCVYLADGSRAPSAGTLRIFAALHGIWLVTCVMFWAMAWQAERAFRSDMADLAEHYGRPLTHAGLLAAYYHDGQEASAPESPLATAVAAGVRRRGDGRLPAVPAAEALELLEQRSCRAEALQRLRAWADENRKFFGEMDRCAEGALFKVDVARTGNRYGRRLSVISNLTVWMQAYLARLTCVALAGGTGAGEEGLELLKRMGWLRDSALDDPFLLANGNCVALENLRLQGIATLVGGRRLTDGQLRRLAEELERDSRRWAERTAHGAWGALAWYMANVQNMDGGGAFHGDGAQSPFGNLLIGLASPMHLWMLRMDGRWLLDEYLARRDQPMDLPSPDADAAFARGIPGTATTAVRLAVPVRRQFFPVLARQLGLIQAIGCERYRLRRGSLPVALAELVPQVMPSLPRDPFGGGSFRYRSFTRQILEGGASLPCFTVYSVGWDRQDDGGVSLKTERDAAGRVTAVREDVPAEIWPWAELPWGEMSVGQKD